MSDGVVTRPRTILEDIQQTKPFRSRSQEAVLALIRSSDDILRHLAGVLEPSGITVQQYNVLRILRGAGEEGLPTLVVGERMLERTPGVTRLIDRMEKKAWVARKRCTADRRRVWCRITQSGLDLLASLGDVVNAVAESLANVLDEHELVQLIDFLDRIRADLNPDPEDSLV
ncbi:MAG: MarR family transcriptional regulator [Gemmatimonadetes bacterium]|nr:MarR family transcriptional regulator [Gemmatimonadota bacterium]